MMMKKYGKLDRETRLDIGETNLKPTNRHNLYTFIFVIVVCVAICFCLGLTITTFSLSVVWSIMPKKLIYEQHEKMHYDFVGNVVSKGTDGRTSEIKIESTLVIHCLITDPVHKSNVFQVNMVNTTYYNVTDEVEEIIDYIPGNFGEALWYNQSYDGEILEIIKPFDEDDSFQLKVNAINSLQMYVPMSAYKRKFKSSNGIYDTVSKYSAGKNFEKVIKTNLDKRSFRTYSDSDIDEKYQNDDNYNFISNSKKIVNTAGKISSVELFQATKYAKDDPEDDEKDGSVSSEGTLKLTLKKIEFENIYPPPFWKNSSEIRRVLDPEMDDPERRKIEVLLKGDLSEMGLYIVRMIKEGRFSVEDLTTQLVTELMLPIPVDDQVAVDNAINIANQLAYLMPLNWAFFTVNFRPLFYPTSTFSTYSYQHKDILFYILTVIGNEECQNILDDCGFSSNVVEDRLTAVMSARNIENPTIETIDKLTYLYNNDPEADVRNSALLSYAVLSTRLGGRRRSLMTNFMRGLFTREKTNFEIKTILYAFENAGIELKDYHMDLVLERNDVRMINVAVPLLSENSYHRRMILHLDSIRNETYPYNKHGEWEETFGKKYANVHAYASYYLGTDYFCNFMYFNYKVHAEAYADGTLLGMKKRMFHGKVHYERLKGKNLGNEVFLKIWGKTIFHKELPVLPEINGGCTWEVIPLWHTQKGFDVRYYIGVSVFSVTVKIGASIALDLGWGYNLCDEKMESRVAIIPQAGFMVYGGIGVNLFLVKGGVEVSAGLVSRLLPNVFISGSTCTAGIEVDLILDPLIIDFYVWWKFRSCSYKFPFKLKCGWGSKHKKTIWDYRKDKVVKNLYKKHWAIWDIIKRSPNPQLQDARKRYITNG